MKCVSCQNLFLVIVYMVLKRNYLFTFYVICEKKFLYPSILTSFYFLTIRCRIIQFIICSKFQENYHQKYLGSIYAVSRRSWRNQSWKFQAVFKADGMLRSVFGVILTLHIALIGASPPVAPGETWARPRPSVRPPSPP